MMRASNYWGPRLLTALSLQPGGRARARLIIRLALCGTGREWKPTLRDLTLSALTNLRKAGLVKFIEGEDDLGTHSLKRTFEITSQGSEELEAWCRANGRVKLCIAA